MAFLYESKTRITDGAGIDVADIEANQPAADAKGLVVRVAGVGTVQFADWARDAFGRLRISNPETIFDSKQVADNQALIWDDQQISGAGTSSTYNTNQASTTLAVSNLTAGLRARQTFRRFNYQTAKSQLIFMTAVLGAGVANVTRRIGLFDDRNGLFFELAGTTLRVVRRTYTSGSVVDTSTGADHDQANWNIDKLDGTGKSGISIDTSKSQIFVIDFEWLGVGIVRFGFVIDGVLYYCHQMNHANNLTLVYMSNPNLPLRYEISNTGGGGAASLVHICSSVITEGGRQRSGFQRAADRGTTVITTNNDTNKYGVLAMRLKAAYLFATVVPTELSLICTSSSAYRWALVANPTVSAGAYGAWTSVANSPVEFQAPPNTLQFTAGSGLLLASGYVNQDASNKDAVLSQLTQDFALGSTIAGVSDIIVLAVQRLTGTTASFYGSLTWREQV